MAGYGARIQQAILDHASHLGRPYRPAEFARDVGLAEVSPEGKKRNKEYGRSTLADWLAERNQPSLETFAAMEFVLERPGIRVWLAFGVWPAASAEGQAYDIARSGRTLPELGLGGPVTPSQVGDVSRSGRTKRKDRGK